MSGGRLATPEDLPAELRALARRVPTTARLNMSAVELELRCEEAASLLAEADMADSEDAARAKRREADRVINAMSMGAFLAEKSRLEGSLAEARLKQGSYEAADRADELRRLYRQHPQPWERISGALLEAAASEVEKRQSAANRPRWFRRFFRRVK